MNNMFTSASNFNQMGVSSWTVTNVVGVDYDAGTPSGMESMFENAVRFNQDLNWTPTNCQNFYSMFSGCSQFDGSMFYLTTAAIIMESMFEDAVSFTGKNINKLETLAVTKMTSMFKGATVFNSACAASSTNTNIWKVEAVTTFESMFEGASTFNQNINNWKPTAAAAVTEGLKNMFKSATNYAHNLCGWNAELNTATGTDMFEGTKCPTKAFLAGATIADGEICCDCGGDDVGTDPVICAPAT